MRSKVISNFISYGIDMFYVSLIGMLFYVLIGKMMIPSDYGIMMTVIALYLVISPLTAIGFNEAVAKFIPELSAKSNNKIKPTLKYAYKTSFILTAIVSIIIYLLSGFIAENIYSNPFMTEPLQMFSLLLFFGTTSMVLKGVLQGFKMFKQMLYMDIFAQSFRLGLPLFLVAIGYGIFGALSGWIVCFILITLISLPLISKMVPGGYGTEDRQILKYGITSALSASGIWLLIQTGVLILSTFDTYAAGLFSAVTVFGQIVLFMPLVIMGIILPYVTEYLSTAQFEKAKRMVQFSLKNIVICLMPLIITLVFFSRQAITYIYNIEYIGAQDFLFPYLFGSVLLGLNLILMTVLYAGGYPIKRLKYTWFAVVINLILSYGLFQMIGAVGISYGFMLSQIVLFILISARTNTKLKITFPRKILNSIPPIILFYGMLYLINKYYYGFKYALMFLVISFAIYFGLLYLFRAINSLDFDVVKTVFGIK